MTDEGASEVTADPETTEEVVAVAPIFADERDAVAGIAVDGHGLPLNHRLRAERLADADANEDPAGMISPELIVDAKDRLAAERKATPPVTVSMKVAELESIAKREGIDISGASNNEQRVAMIEASRSGTVADEENA